MSCFLQQQAVVVHRQTLLTLQQAVSGAQYISRCWGERTPVTCKLPSRKTLSRVDRITMNKGYIASSVKRRRFYSAHFQREHSPGGEQLIGIKTRNGGWI